MWRKNSIRGSVGANVDITEAREAEERLRELQSQVLHASRLSAMGQMAAALAHELRDFVTRGEADKRVVNARRLVEDAVALALVGRRDPELRMRLDFDPSDPWILADNIQIQQVVFNLVRNALEAMEGRPTRELIVATKAVGDTAVEISVADSGSGLPPDPEMLFRPFESSKPMGMGIGLSSCRTIVEAHGGHLRAERRQGGGALFRFTVPTASKGGTNDDRAHHSRGG